MLTKIFVLLKIEAGNEKAVKESLTSIREVVNAHLVAGAYDIIVQLEGESFSTLRDVILDQIRRVPNVIQSVTCPAVETI